MTDWIRVDIDLLDHIKIVRLSKINGEPEYSTAGRLIALWSFTQIHAWKDGDLSEWGVRRIESICRWDGQSGLFYKALNDVHLLDDMKIHNWHQYATRYIQQRVRRERLGKKQKGYK